jgi:predicted amidohydrolase
MAKKTVLSTTQFAWKGPPREANPFSDSFTMEAARAWSRARLDDAIALLARAGEMGADLSLTGENITGLGHPMCYLDDPTIFQTLARESSAWAHEEASAVAKRYHMHVVACFCEPEGDAIYNTAALYGREGERIGTYHKVHLPAVERWLMRAGGSFPAFETDIGMVGMLICYDDMWPESSAACALNGARIICHPTAYSPPRYRVRTRAMDQQVFYITSTFAGSRICAPNSAVLADCGDAPDSVVIAEADIAHGSLAPENSWEYLYSGVRDHRERHLRFRRPEAYGAITDPDPRAREVYTGEVAETPEAIRRAYQRQKEEFLRELRGEASRYTWEWCEDSPRDGD